jgi:hypothetical protein
VTVIAYPARPMLSAPQRPFQLTPGQRGGKVREAMAEEIRGRKLGGAGKVAETARILEAMFAPPVSRNAAVTATC